VIAVFTKYDQFKRDIEMKLADQGRDPELLDDEMERIFREHYLANLRRPPPPYVSLKGEGIQVVSQPTWTTTLISVVQECIRKANNAWNLSKQLPGHSIMAQLPSYSCQYKRIIWS
jgi:hypothetical protein